MIVAARAQVQCFIALSSLLWQVSPGACRFHKVELFLELLKLKKRAHQVAVCSFFGDLYLSLEMSVAVIGAGGGCGLEVTKLLLSAGKAVRCIVRDPAKVSPR